jgi:D-3-phosphoglycerate dehydrogenase / 2-oxoglutarate reductase
MKIVVAEKISSKALDVLRQETQWQVLTADQIQANGLLSQVSDADALIVRSAVDVNAGVIDAAKKLRVVGRAGVGVDNIDSDAATRRGIVVMNTPGANAVAVAEHTLGLMLSLARFISRADQATRAGKWEKKSLQGRELKGKTLGIIGLGRIGVEVVRRARAFAMEIVAYDPFVSSNLARDLEITMLSLDELYARSDYISLHVGLTPQTQGMINAGSLAKMKKGVRIVNCARGELIEESALEQALKSGHVAGAALDVYRKEPPGENPLFSLPNVIATPHIAGSTDEAQEAVGVQIAQQVKEYLERGVIQNAVNIPSLTDEEYAAMQPYLSLAERMGLFLAQLTDTSVQEICIEYSGRIAEWKTALLRNAAVAGVLKGSAGESANLVNAKALAAERQIQVSESKQPANGANLLAVELRGAGGKVLHSAQGTVLHADSPRLLALDGIDIEVALEERLIVLRNRDVPGVVGRVGTVLGRNQINIASFSLGRAAKQRISAAAHATSELRPLEAIAVIQVDHEPNQSVIEELKRIEQVTSVKLVQL